MLAQSAALLPVGGLLFLVLPSACITNSRYIDEGRMLWLLRSIGLEPCGPLLHSAKSAGSNFADGAAAKPLQALTKRRRRAGEAVLVDSDGCRTAAKLWFCVAVKRAPAPQDGLLGFSRQFCREGKSRNNFAIVLKPRNCVVSTNGVQVAEAAKRKFQDKRREKQKRKRLRKAAAGLQSSNIK
eukprot:SAG31_NODE_2708_length_5211_cov_4.189163_2_plen_183_part_00